MASRAAFAHVMRALSAATSGASGAVLGGPAAVGPQRHGHRGCASECREQREGRLRRPVAGTSGCCAASGVRFYAARSRPAAESACCFAIAEELHQFAVLDGVGGAGDAGAQCARFCAGQLPGLVARAFLERVRRSPLASARDMDGALVSEEESAAESWAEALTAGFAQCDRLAADQVEGGCGAILCTVACSGVYAASVGLGRVVVGTEVDGSTMLLCDEVSSPHSIQSEAEVSRLGRPFPPAHAPTRLLGGAAEKRAEPRLIGLPDVARHQHAQSRRFVLLGSPGVWHQGPQLPLQWAVEAYRTGRSPADEVVARSKGTDVVALVLVLPPGLGGDGSPLPPHEELALPRG
mmetsp:Transcript_21847/g.68112  ORF Transcript_21847/g.68112 Transcript_21847/m.68112 type:complete len:351 (-) Transcript_21847:40-1092(-)